MQDCTLNARLHFKYKLHIIYKIAYQMQDYTCMQAYQNSNFTDDQQQKINSKNRSTSFTRGQKQFRH